MVHAAEQMICIEDNLMAALTSYVGDETDAAAVVLEFGTIETLFRERAVRVLLRSSMSRSHGSPWRSRRKPRSYSLWYCRFQPF
jgi:hypothetical protein